MYVHVRKVHWSNLLHFFSVFFRPYILSARLRKRKYGTIRNIMCNDIKKISLSLSLSSVRYLSRIHKDYFNGLKNLFFFFLIEHETRLSKP